uniref:Uncharacterized protein n=1 Tax=Anopheles melas TaxID=34690 RepID=A0A182TF34_9DIPT
MYSNTLSSLKLLLVWLLAALTYIRYVPKAFAQAGALIELFPYPQKPPSYPQYPPALKPVEVSGQKRARSLAENSILSQSNDRESSSVESARTFRRYFFSPFFLGLPFFSFPGCCSPPPPPPPASLWWLG